MRGSTRRHDAKRRRPLGCPAHAGIDPNLSELTIPLDRLPRACGDRPRLMDGAVGGKRVAPRMRGSTSPYPRRSRAHRGCPAHAGIDLPYPPAPRSGGRLPRACGDRPPSTADAELDDPVAPRMRGSTFTAVFPCPAKMGCPAHAGIDPDRHLHRDARRRLPRACGDRPASPKRRENCSTVAPRMRGSTLKVFPGRFGATGCPAHAGIDPHIITQLFGILGLPRACGDRPVAEHGPILL